jgi:hypothetical protein
MHPSGRVVIASELGGPQCNRRVGHPGGIVDDDTFSRVIPPLAASLFSVVWRVLHRTAPPHSGVTAPPRPLPKEHIFELKDPTGHEKNLLAGR